MESISGTTSVDLMILTKNAIGERALSSVCVTRSMSKECREQARERSDPKAELVMGYMNELIIGGPET